MLVGEVYGSFDELCTPAAVFGAIVQVDQKPRRIDISPPIRTNVPPCDP